MQQRLAHVNEFICKTNNGYETIVGDKGIKLRGGQKQRLRLSRAPAVIVKYLSLMNPRVP